MAQIAVVDFIPTRSSLLKKRSAENFKAVVYESYKPKPKKPKLGESETETKVSNNDGIDMRRARHEIVKFGMSGFDTQKKEEAKIQLAIRLGARPPKNKYKNYKILQEEKKKEIETRNQQIDFQQLGKNKLGKSIAKGKSFDRNRKKEKGAFLDNYGKPTLKESSKNKK